MQKKVLSSAKSALDQLQPGDVILYPPNTVADGGWVGQAIVHFTKGEISHSAIYLGVINGVPMIAHAEPGGLNSMPFADLLAGEPCCYIRRRTGRLDLTPVLEAAHKYTDVGNTYPFISLGVIGLLILLNKFSNETIKSRVVYDFAMLVGVKMMKEVEERFRPGKTPMMCSQLVSQCYTDAGTKYDLKFDKLLLQFGNVPKTEGESSLLELLSEKDTLEIPTKIDDSILLRENAIVENFFDFMNMKTAAKKVGISANISGNVIDANNLTALAKLMLAVSCRAITGQAPTNVKDALKIFSTNRNYLVTPDDLMANATNLKTIGYMKNLYDQTNFFKFVGK